MTTEDLYSFGKHEHVAWSDSPLDSIRRVAEKDPRISRINNNFGLGRPTTYSVILMVGVRGNLDCTFPIPVQSLSDLENVKESLRYCYCKVCKESIVRLALHDQLPSFIEDWMRGLKSDR